MNTDVMFSRATDDWETPTDVFLWLDDEFRFSLDAAATHENSKYPTYLGPDHAQESCRDALSRDWAEIMGSRIATHAVWLNPPYSRCLEFMTKAAVEARKGCTVVCLVPARTDTRWWFAHVVNENGIGWRPGVEVRFVKGRLKFGNGKNSAPFPSVVVIFRPPV